MSEFVWSEFVVILPVVMHPRMVSTFKQRLKTELSQHAHTHIF